MTKLRSSETSEHNAVNKADSGSFSTISPLSCSSSSPTHQALNAKETSSCSTFRAGDFKFVIDDEESREDVECGAKKIANVAIKRSVFREGSTNVANEEEAQGPVRRPSNSKRRSRSNDEECKLNGTTENDEIYFLSSPSMSSPCSMLREGSIKRNIQRNYASIPPMKRTCQRRIEKANPICSSSESVAILTSGFTSGLSFMSSRYGDQLLEWTNAVDESGIDDFFGDEDTRETAE